MSSPVGAAQALLPSMFMLHSSRAPAAQLNMRKSTALILRACWRYTEVHGVRLCMRKSGTH